MGNVLFYFQLRDTSESSSDTDLKGNSSNNVVSSTFNDTVTSSSEEGGSVPIKVSQFIFIQFKLSNTNFYQFFKHPIL